MNRFFDTKYLKKVALSTISVLIALVVIIYVLYGVTNGFSPGVKTIAAQLRETRQTVRGQGFLFRDEYPVFSDYAGTVDYKVSSGQRLPAGGEIATVYREGDRTATKKLLEIDRTIALLESSNIGDNVSLTTTRTTDAQIEDLLYKVRANLTLGDLGDAGSYTDNLLSLLNRRELIVTEKNSYNAEIEVMREQRRELALSLTGESQTVNAEKSGWFFLGSDGNEEIFTSDKALNMSFEDFILLSENTPEGKVPEGCIGKIALSEKWFVAMTVDITATDKLSLGKGTIIDFGAGIEVEMELVRLEAKDKRALLVFTSGEAPEGFDFNRQQNVQIILSEYEGLGVPTSAIHFYDGYPGVFVLYGSTVFFRVADIIGEQSGYSFISTETEPVTYIEITYDGDNNEVRNTRIKYGSLKLYDSVITEGRDLYHGKILN